MQFDRAEELCKKTLEIHRAHSEPASLEEASDRRLMALICEAKGDYESALEHLVLASMAMIANAQDTEVAAIDVSIGDCVSANLIRLYFPSLRIYARPMLGALSEDISSGSTEISAIY